MECSDIKKTCQDYLYTEKAAKTVLAPFLKRLKKPSSIKDVQKLDLDNQKTFVRNRMKEVVSRLMSFFTDSLELPVVLNETAEILREVIKAVGVSSYIVDSRNHVILNAKYMPKNHRHTVKYKIEAGKTVAAYVAYYREFVMVDDILGDLRFPLGVAGAGKLVKSVLCVPVLTGVDGRCIAVIELFRNIHQEPFTTLDLQLCVSMTGWMGAAIHQNNERLSLLKKNELGNYLMSLVEFFFAGALSFDKFVSDIIECAKLFVGADRGYFYLMDEEIPVDTEDDILADVYQEGLDSTCSYKKKNKQRFTKHSKLLAGYVARKGKIVNVQDAIEDMKYMTTPDISGNITRSVVAVPLKGSLGVLGVLMLVNKTRENYFNTYDEMLLEYIAGHAFLACRHLFTVEQLRKANFRQIGHLDLLYFQMKPCPDDLNMLLMEPALKRSELPKNFFDFDWIIYGHERQIVDYSVFMFLYLLGDKYFDYPILAEFILTVKKSYRYNNYHNFVHAFTVCHCAFNIINRNRENFTDLEVLGLLIATICHDADHNGFTNNFLQMTNHWLAELYWESPLENHHYDVCVIMIEGTNILYKLSSSEKITLKAFIKHVILSSDLVQFFRQRHHLLNLLKAKTFDLNVQEHRKLFIGVLMTVSDVSGQCKPFYSAKKVTEGLYKEFHIQGDLEKSLGFTPMDMMDREKKSAIPEHQCQFLTLVCIPSVEILVTIFPNTEKLLKQCKELRDCWSTILSRKVIDVWKYEECLVTDSVRRKSRARSTFNKVLLANEIERHF